MKDIGLDLRRLVFLGVGLLVAAAWAQPALASPAAEGKFERTLAVTGPVDLEVTTGSGNITVRPGPAGSVQVHGWIRASSDWFGGLAPEEKVKRLKANPPIVQTGNIIRIGKIEDRELKRNVSISYELVVPAETKLRMDSGSGDQQVSGVRGPVVANTGSGNIWASDIGGNLEADTGSGDVVLERVRGDVRADTGSGSVRATDVGGSLWSDTGSGDVVVTFTSASPAGDHRVDVDTGSGNVEVRGARGSVTVDTGSGDIRVEGEPTESWKLSAGSGDVTARVPAQAAFDLDAHSDSGSLSSAHPGTVLGTLGRQELKGKVRGGGAVIWVDTGSGNIRIE